MFVNPPVVIELIAAITEACPLLDVSPISNEALLE